MRRPRALGKIWTLTLGVTLAVGSVTATASADDQARPAAGDSPAADTPAAAPIPTAPAQTAPIVSTPSSRQLPCAETCVCRCTRSRSCPNAEDAPVGLARHPRLMIGLLLGYQLPPSLAIAERAGHRLGGDGSAELTLGWRFGRWISLSGYLGIGGWRLYDGEDRPFNDVLTIRAGAALRLHLPLALLRVVRPFAELRGGYLWLGEAEDERRNVALPHPRQLDLPEGYELAYGGGLDVPLGTPMLSLTVRVLYHQLFLRGPLAPDGGPSSRQRAGHLSIAVGFTVQLPLSVRR